MRFSSSSKTSHNRFAKISGSMNSLYLGASFAPRIEQAASQIQVSSDFPLPFVIVQSPSRRRSVSFAAPALRAKQVGRHERLKKPKLFVEGIIPPPSDHCRHRD